MRLLQLTSNGELSLTKNRINNIPPYAILSHTWGDDEEVVTSTFKDLSGGSGKTKTGYGRYPCDGAVRSFFAPREL
jgi:hypothetical protein